MQVTDLESMSYDELQELTHPLDQYISDPAHEAEYLKMQASTMGANTSMLVFVRMCQIRQLLMRIEQLERACGGNWRKEQ